MSAPQCYAAAVALYGDGCTTNIVWKSGDGAPLLRVMDDTGFVVEYVHEMLVQRQGSGGWRLHSCMVNGINIMDAVWPSRLRKVISKTAVQKATVDNDVAWLRHVTDTLRSFDRCPGIRHANDEFGAYERQRQDANVIPGVRVFTVASLRDGHDVFRAAACHGVCDGRTCTACYSRGSAARGVRAREAKWQQRRESGVTVPAGLPPKRQTPEELRHTVEQQSAEIARLRREAIELARHIQEKDEELGMCGVDFEVWDESARAQLAAANECREEAQQAWKDAHRAWKANTPEWATCLPPIPWTDAFRRWKASVRVVFRTEQELERARDTRVQLEALVGVVLGGEHAKAGGALSETSAGGVMLRDQVRRRHAARAHVSESRLTPALRARAAGKGVEAGRQGQTFDAVERCHDLHVLQHLVHITNCVQEDAADGHVASAQRAQNAPRTQRPRVSGGWRDGGEPPHHARPGYGVRP